MRRLIAGVLVACTPPLFVQADMTNMLDLMEDVGVPVNNANTVYFGWNPIVPPNDPANLAMESRWNFGLAMYQYTVGSEDFLRFTFVNGRTDDPVLSSIFTSFLFDDGDPTGNGAYFHSGRTILDEPPLSNPLLWTSGGVDFVQGGGQLPEGDNQTAMAPYGGTFDTTNSISWVRDSGQTAQYNGVHNGVNAIPEYITFEYDFGQNVSFGDVYLAFLNRNLRIGTHVQGFVGPALEDGENFNSESILWSIPGDVVPPPPGPLDPPAVVPVPGAASLGLLGFGLIAAARRRARK